MKVLVDTSIWIAYFSKGLYKGLDSLIMEDLVTTNDVILTELIPFLHNARAYDAIKALKHVHKYDMEIFWPGLIELQKINLLNGVNKVGIPDLLIADHAIKYNLLLWSDDKHFALMAPYTELTLFSPV